MAYVTRQRVLEEAGLWQRQLQETPAGSANGTNTIYTVDHKPLTDNNYDDSVTAADVTAYVNGSSVTVNAVNATTGAITLTTAPGAGTDVTIDYSYSPVALTVVAEVIQEAEDWIDTELSEVVETPLDPVPARVRAICRVYAAGLLMLREYALQNNDEGTSAGEAKIKLAERWLSEYRARLVANGEDTGSTIVPVSTSSRRLFQRYNSSEGRWDPLADESFTTNGVE